MKNTTLNNGSRFSIKTIGKSFKNKIFTVAEIADGSDIEFTIKCTDQRGDIHYFSRVNLDYHADNVKILVDNQS